MFDPSPAVRDALRVLTLGAVAVAGVVQFVNIVKLQHRRRNEPEDAPRRRSTDRPRKAAC